MENVGKGYEKVASDVQQKFDAQQQEIQNLSTVVLETQKAMQTNAETLHSLLTGMENLGENMRSMQEDMMSWQQEFHNEEEEFQELQDQLLREVPLADPVRDQNEGNIPPVVSKPLTTLPKMPTIVEEPAIQSKDQSEVPRTSEEERLDSYSMERWRRLVGKDVREPIKGNKVPGPAEGQTQIPQFFNAYGSREQGPVPLPVSLPAISAPVNVNVTPRRINPTPVIPQGTGHGTNVIQGAGSVTGNPSGTTEGTIDLRTETSSTTQSKSQPTVGNTSIMTEEARRIHEMVHDAIREQFAAGRAALRSNLGLPAQDLTTIGDMAKGEGSLNVGSIPLSGSSQKNAPSTVPVGNAVPRSSFGSPLPVQNASPSVPSFASGLTTFCNCCVEAKGASVLLWPKH